MRNSTIIPKKKSCVSCGRNDYIFSKGRCKQCSTIESTQKRMEKVSEKLIEEDNLQDLIKDADAIFSKYIRLKYADEYGNVACYTCGNKKHWTLQQAGHFIPRSNLFLRFDERNLRAQDSDCNEFKRGNMAVFSQRLEQEQPGIVDILREEAAVVYKPTRDEIRQIISEYTKKVKELKSKVNSVK